MTEGPEGAAVTDSLRARDEAAVHAYRDTGDPAHLDLLRQDGLPGLAHALSMESVMPDGKRGRYTAEVDAWLGAASVKDYEEEP